MGTWDRFARLAARMEVAKMTQLPAAAPRFVTGSPAWQDSTERPPPAIAGRAARPLGNILNSRKVFPSRVAQWEICARLTQCIPWRFLRRGRASPLWQQCHVVVNRHKVTTLRHLVRSAGSPTRTGGQHGSARDSTTVCAICTSERKNIHATPAPYATLAPILHWCEWSNLY